MYPLHSFYVCLSVCLSDCVLKKKRKKREKKAMLPCAANMSHWHLSLKDLGLVVPGDSSVHADMLMMP